MAQFPTGTVTFLVTDIEQSTKGWERDASVARVVVERHLALIRQAVEAHRGVHFKTIGDATQSAFATAPLGVAAALDAQRALLSEPWPSEEHRPRVRMALHAGTAEPRDGDYLAASLNRLARLLDTAHGSQILLSSTVAGLARDALPEAVTLLALGEYRLRDILQPEEIFQLHHPELPADFPPLKTPSELPHNLPIQPTPFLGRDWEVEEITALLLRPNVRLVTLTGPGGVGKTRLGLRVAAEVLESFPDGVFLIDLSRQTDPDLIPSATATALGLREQLGQTLQETLAGFLRERLILLLFDNFEHVLPAATLVADLLASAPGLKVLTTSRARLELQAEYEYRVEPLPIPNHASLPPLADLASYDAVELFTSRAQALRPNFTLTEENARAVAEIVCQLDGLPLAIELAAARAKLLSPDALLERLDRRLSTLTGGARDLPARQRTLRDTIAWSYDLLASSEKMLLRRLSVFVGDWTLEGAEAVAVLNPTESVDALQGLAALLDQSLIDQRPAAGTNTSTDEPRYGMLETIRDFAIEQLAASGEIIQAEQAFEAFLIAKVEAAEAGLRGPEQPLWLDRLDAEHDNLRAALTRVLERGDSAVAIGLARRLWEFWWIRGHPGEGRSWLERVLNLADESDTTGRAAVEFGLGHIYFELGNLEEAQTHLQASLDLWERSDDQGGVAAALSVLAVVAINRYAYAEARTLGERALELRRQLGDRRGEATTLNYLAMAAREEGDLPRASALYEQSLTLWSERNEPAGTASVLLSLGITRRMAGDRPAAEKLLKESWALYEKLGDRNSLAVIALERGHLARQVDDHANATRLYGLALTHFTDVGGSLGMVEALEWLAATAVDQDAAAPALRLFSAAQSARDALGFPPPAASDASILEMKTAQAESAVGDNAAQITAEGRALPLAAATSEAFALAQTLSTVTIASSAN